jgi:hypothetical protein
MTYRTLEQHVALYAAYSNAIAALPAVAWERLRARCVPLEGDAFTTVLRRARFQAKAYEIPVLTDHPSRGVRAVVRFGRVTQISLGVITELAGEFTERSTDSSASPRRPIFDPKHARFGDAWFAIESALQSSTASVGVATVVRAAGQALLRHDFLAPATFAEVYGFIEPEIPFASVEQSAGGG